MKIKVVQKKLGREKLRGYSIFETGEIGLDERLKGREYLEVRIP